jgi:HSP20 family protein
MNVTRLEPYSLLSLLNRDLAPFENRLSSRPASDERTPGAWLPAVDIVEEKEHFLLRADLPGVTPDNIELTTEKGVLHLSGERHSDASEGNNGLQRRERVSGKFDRRFSLPETADTDSISAASHNGILEVTIPKLPEIQQRRITVEAA